MSQKSRCWGWHTVVATTYSPTCTKSCGQVAHLQYIPWGTEPAMRPAHRGKSSVTNLHKLQKVFFSFNPLFLSLVPEKVKAQHLEHKKRRKGPHWRRISCTFPSQAHVWVERGRRKGKREVNQSFCSLWELQNHWLEAVLWLQANKGFFSWVIKSWPG